jgi:hypothetical protein
MTFKNDVYDQLQNHIKNHHGFSKSDLTENGLLDQYIRAMETIKQFHQKKVILKYRFQKDWFSGSNEKTGKIIVNQEGRPCFYEGRKRTKFQYLDAGLYDGWFATVCPMEIIEL